jgi:hypothetical protein
MAVRLSRVVTALPMHVAMNTVAHASAMPAGGAQLDNRRVIAGLVDLLVVLGGALLIGLAAGLSGTEYRAPGLALSGVIIAWALYYYFACESGGGQTLGKKLMKIRVVRVDGSPAGMPDIAVRTVLRLIDGSFLYLVGLIVMLATGGRARATRRPGGGDDDRVDGRCAGAGGRGSERARASGDAALRAVPRARAGRGRARPSGA